LFQKRYAYQIIKLQCLIGLGWVVAIEEPAEATEQSSSLTPYLREATTEESRPATRRETSSSPAVAIKIIVLGF
jgi:hypothetical protein